MSKEPVTIPKQPVLKPAEDFYLLRREGIRYIEQMGSKLWTDYNTHDPGITILDALSFAHTELAYGIGWEIKDILMPKTPPADKSQPYPNQAFFTAREILTVNPTTQSDFRRMLIDLEGVRNAWVICRDCACDVKYYAWCEKDQLKLSYDKPKDPHVKVEPLGLYDVLLELEKDPELGDLNNRKIEHSFVVKDDDGAPHQFKIELRFPEWGLEKEDDWKTFLKVGANLNFYVTGFGATEMYNIIEDLRPEEWDEYLRDHWRDVFYCCFESLPSDRKIAINNVALRLFGDAFVKNELKLERLISLLDNESTNGFIHLFHKKEKQRLAVIKSAKTTLLAHRNLDEDYCHIKVVDVEDIAVCADIEVKPDTDIEWVQAKIFFEIEQYFNPPIHFYSLKEMMDDGESVEEIFNGPELKSGFIKTGDLEAASLKSVLRVSDIINKLMDIDGVSAVNHLQMTGYDAEGNIIRGAADPDFTTVAPVFDPNKISASWLLYVSKHHQPRLYLNGSNFLFYKNGLPFKPRTDEVRDTLIQLRGEAERPKIKGAPADLPIPAGTYRNPEDYFPVQYSFPLAYGIGPDGLPSHVSDERRAQAKQLKAYLMVFEQILGNALAQIAHTSDLFSLDSNIKKTYFEKELSETIIQGYDDLVKSSLDEAVLHAMNETVPEFQERRNRFLDHIMARFGEQFNEYALLLTSLEGQQVTLDQLINDKIAFLSVYPQISHDRARAFDYSQTEPDKEVSRPGIKKRISLLLGYPDLTFQWRLTALGVNKFRLKFQLSDKDKVIWTGYLRVDADSEAEAKLYGRRAVIERMSLSENYKIARKVILKGPDKFALRLKGSVDEAHGRYTELFDTEADAAAMRDELVAWSAFERVIVVEHLLLRPKFPGDALYPACPDGACATCGDEDPYSFKLTFVMPGWVEPFKTNMEMRSFAERTIRQETPSHLLCKICWVDKDDFDRFEDAWNRWLEANADIDWTEERLNELVEAILEKSLINNRDSEKSGKDFLCKCAADILASYGAAFYDWMNDNLKTGKPIGEFTSFKEPMIDLCSNEFETDTDKKISELLNERYKTYREVSCRLWVVVEQLSKLTNIYPAATLHDWDEGNDQNPVRLGKTALGS